MTSDGALPPITPLVPVVLLAELLTELDEFLRSSPIIATDLASYLACRGHTHPRFVANDAIDSVSFSFTIARLRVITNCIDKTAAGYVHLTDCIDAAYRQNG